MRTATATKTPMAPTASGTPSLAAALTGTGLPRAILPLLSSTRPPKRARPADARPLVENAVKSERARARRQQHGPADSRPDLRTRSLLERRSVRASTERDYQQRYGEFRTWCRRSRLSIRTKSDLQTALIYRMHEMYFDGDLCHEAEKLMASVTYERVDMQKGLVDLPRARLALEGFRKLSPPRSRLPLPWLVVAGLINEMVRAKAWESAIATAIAFVLYLRPSEALRLRQRDVVAPHPKAGAHMSHWSVILNPWEMETSSKTGEFDESLLHDNVEFAWLNLVFKSRAGNSHKNALFVTLTYNVWNKEFNAAVARLQLDPLGPVTLYQLRHGGASHELASSARPLAAIKKRGRWRSDRSLYRYEKGGRLQQQLGLLSTPLVTHCRACADNIGRILSGTSPPLSVPQGARSH